MAQRTRRNGRPVSNEAKQMALREMEAITNVVTSRSMLLKQLMDPRRDIDHECGYPDTSTVTAQEYQELYDRHGVATRVVEVMPLEMWKVVPDVYEDEDMDVSTPFEEAWEDLGRNLLVEEDEESLYVGESGNPIWEYFRRIDVLSGIGHFGVMLLGFADGRPLSEPVQGTKNQLLFVRCFPESLVDISAWENDQTSPRYGKPKQYLIRFHDLEAGQASIGMPASTMMVHWTRVIHVANTLTSSEHLAVPEMQPVLNNLLDLKKLYGGSAEMYWRGAFPGISIETHPQLGSDVSIETDDVKNAMENYMHGLQRYFALTGITAKSLAPQVVDPSPQIRVQIEAICIQKGIPLRIFLGSERGELSSSQDANAWNDRLMARMTTYATPRLICPFVSRLVRFGVLPRPEQFHVDWPDLSKMTDQEKAAVSLQRTDAIVKYVGGSGDQLIEPQNYLTKVLDFTDDEAEEIIEATAGYVEEKQEGEAEQMEEQMSQMDVMNPQGVDQFGNPVKQQVPPNAPKEKEDANPFPK